MYLSRDSSETSRSTSTTATDDSCSNTTNNTPPKEPVVTQRVTRSSQRYAQQNGDNSTNESKNNTAIDGIDTEDGGGGNLGGGSSSISGHGGSSGQAASCDRSNTNDRGGDKMTSNNGSGGGTTTSTNNTSIDQSGRKAKRKKLEQQAELDGQDPNQQAQQPTFIPEFCPSDYRPPESNPIELYRTLIRRRQKGITNLKDSHAYFQLTSRIPCGTKDYLLFNGPYLLEGHKIGVGMSGPPISSNNPSLFSHHNQQQHPQQHQHNLPRLKMKLSRTCSGVFELSPPPNLTISQPPSKTHNHSHRLNTYTLPQQLDPPDQLRSNHSPLYELFQSQESARHKMRMQHVKERERSILAAEQEILRAYNYHPADSSSTTSSSHLSACSYFNQMEKYHYTHEKNGIIESLDYPPVPKDLTTGKSIPQQQEQQQQQQQQSQPLSNESNPIAEDSNKTNIATSDVKSVDNKSSLKDASHSAGAFVAAADDDDDDKTVENSPERQTVISRLVRDLQDLDDKWTKIKREMFVRHKNEADTLHAIQSLEWDWRSKETGACDKEFVPRVEVSAQEY